MFFDGGGAVAELELCEFGAVCDEELCESGGGGARAWVEGVGKVGGEDGEVGEEGHVPCCEDEEGGVVECYFEGAQGGESEHYWGAVCGGGCDCCGLKGLGGNAGMVEFGSGGGGEQDSGMLRGWRVH